MLCLSLVLLSLCLSQVYTQGYNGCQNREWTYHSHTHSCFRLVKVSRTWTQARAYCQGFWGGTSNDIRGHLARISDWETNQFVKGLMPSVVWVAWIGLTYTRQSGYRWDGYPNEEVTYYDSIFARTSNASSPYVSLTQGGWEEKPTEQNHHTLCQHGARIQPASMLCPTTLVDASAPLTYSLTYRFSFTHWNSIRWIVPSASHGIDIECPNVGSCASNDSRYTAVVWRDEGRATLTYSGLGSLDMKGQWAVSIFDNNDEHLDTRTCDAIEAYTPPSEIECIPDLTPHQLSVTCETARIYPGALCEWTCKYADDSNIHPVSPKRVHDPIHTNSSTTGGNTHYFRSACSITLVSEGTPTLQPGHVTVEVKMYPNFTLADLSTLPSASRTAQQTITIEQPNKPEFRLAEKTIDNDSLSVLMGEKLDLACDIPSGIPLVQSTFVSCDFSVRERTVEFTTSESTLSLGVLFIGPGMDGKSCFCWGTHITGNTFNSSITFHVFEPANVTHFSANRTDQSLIVDEGTSLNVVCQASGQPRPEIALLKGISDLTLQADVAYRLDSTLTVKCHDSGRYRCRAKNSIQGRSYTDVMELVLRVKCLPSLCEDKHVANEQIRRTTTKPDDRSLVVWLCVTGYPPPDVSNFRLQKAVGQSWSDVNLQEGAINLDVSRDGVLAGLTVDLGQFVTSRAAGSGLYRLVYSRELDGSISFLPFRVRASEDNSKEDDNFPTSIIVAVVISIFIIFTIVIIAVGVLFFRIARDQHKGDDSRCLDVAYNNAKIATTSTTTNKTEINGPTTTEGDNCCMNGSFKPDDKPDKTFPPSSSSKNTREENEMTHSKLDFRNGIQTSDSVSQKKSPDSPRSTKS